MFINRRRLNILLILLALLLGGTAVWVAKLPPLGSENKGDSAKGVVANNDSLLSLSTNDALVTAITTQPEPVSDTDDDTTTARSNSTNADIVKASGFDDVDPRQIIAGHPFHKEALKILNNNLEESDSISRRKILSYCEHLRTSYTTKDIDFLRQVFSDNALIIVGNVVKTGKKWDGGSDTKVTYAVRSKHSYLSRLDEVFKANKTIKMDFSDFHIMRHPSMKGIYGVSLRQKYATDKYSDDGYLFLLWDFRNPSMPLIHVRTWQPHRIVAEGEEVIDISDFNLD